MQLTSAGNMSRTSGVSNTRFDDLSADERSIIKDVVNQVLVGPSGSSSAAQARQDGGQQFVQRAEGGHAMSLKDMEALLAAEEELEAELASLAARCDCQQQPRPLRGPKAKQQHLHSSNGIRFEVVSGRAMTLRWFPFHLQASRGTLARQVSRRRCPHHEDCPASDGRGAAAKGYRQPPGRVHRGTVPRHVGRGRCQADGLSARPPVLPRAGQQPAAARVRRNQGAVADEDEEGLIPEIAKIQITEQSARQVGRNCAAAKAKAAYMCQSE